MSHKLPRVTAMEAIRALERAGFVLSRQSGSHKIFKNSQGRRVTVSFHAGTILAILRDADLTVERLLDLLR